MCERGRFNERTRARRRTLRGRVHGRVRISTLLLILACVYASANARRVRERVCKLILSVRGGRERYLALRCGHLQGRYVSNCRRRRW